MAVAGQLLKGTLRWTAFATLPQISTTALQRMKALRQLAAQGGELVGMCCVPGPRLGDPRIHRGQDLGPPQPASASTYMHAYVSCVFAKS